MKYFMKVIILAFGLGTLAEWAWGAPLAPELVVRRCEVIGIGTVEAVADAWSIVPLQAWYPTMKDKDEYLVIGLAKFHLKEILKGETAHRVIRAAFPIAGYKAGAKKRSYFTMTDFRPLTTRDIGDEALWCFQWDDTAQSYVVRFDYQRQTTSAADTLKPLIAAKTWSIPNRLKTHSLHEGILEGTITTVDAKAGTVVLKRTGLRGNPATEPADLTVTLPEWFLSSGSNDLAASDLQVGDAIRVIRRDHASGIDEVKLLTGSSFEDLKNVLSDEGPKRVSRAKKSSPAVETSEDQEP